MKLLVIFVITFSSGFAIYKFFQSPEKVLEKKTKQLISLSSVKSNTGNMGLISQITKISKYIHYDVQIKAEYNQHNYEARSLNEFRSLLMSYFRHSSGNKNLRYENLKVDIKKNKEIGFVNFDIFFKRSSESFSCKTSLEWEKIKKWFIKKIKLHSCKPFMLNN
ncbi:MAG: hypothetical protein OXC37_04295 [Bdellovibrionaceae bacterium]|nr:hypothetical protein [Pseudobdellovibrionaceae bacterium]